MRGDIINLLNKSIIKWERIRDSVFTVNQGIETCPLCVFYLKRESSGCCLKCPLTLIGENCIDNKNSTWSLYDEIVSSVEREYGFLKLKDILEDPGVPDDLAKDLLGLINKMIGNLLEAHKSIDRNERNRINEK